MNFIFQETGLEEDFQNQLRHTLIGMHNVNEIDDFAIRWCTLEALGNPNIVAKLTRDLNNIRDWCPVGTIEFCQKWFTDICGLPYCKPRNLPECLFMYRGGQESPTNHFFENMSNKDDKYLDLVKNVMCYVKSNEIIKHPKNGVYMVQDILQMPTWKDHDIQVSVFEDNIVSEWRAFVFHDSIIDIRCYSGDPFKVPSKKSIEEFISKIHKMDSMLPSYTLDVFVDDNNKTKPLEMHDFFSCGLYGFQSHLLPAMMTQWFFYYKNKCRLDNLQKDPMLPI